MEIENNATGKEVEKIVRELMEGENGKKIKQKSVGVEEIIRGGHGPTWFIIQKFRKFSQLAFIKMLAVWKVFR